uniref:RNA-directed DNA polymerase n=2 Tax=Lygus hesperus TaxID=30085 RepID=A0A0A9X504_LYGHE
MLFRYCMFYTGSTLSILPESFYRAHFSNFLLEPTKIKLKSYDGSIILPVGVVNVMVTYNNRSDSCSFLVVQSGQRPLIGRDLIQHFQINIVFGSAYEQQHTLSSYSPEKIAENIVNEFSELFDGTLGKYKYGKISLKVKDNVQPKFCRPRPIPYAFRKGVDHELEKLENLGVISKIETSQWGTPLVPVLKPDNTVRVCSDYKVTLNKYLEDVEHPVPRIEDIFNKLQGGQLFSKLDFSHAYNQLEVDEETSIMLAWSTHKGIFKVNRLPFGTKPACQIFQREVDKTLQGCEGVACLLDDIVITGRSMDEHVHNLRTVLVKLKSAGFKLNKNKCKFFQDGLKFLGHIIDKEGLRKDPSKIDAILKAPIPKNVSEVKAFVGMINYHGRFIKNLSIILAPLYDLLKKNTPFQWSKECDRSFQKLKKIITSDQILVHFNPDLEIVLECDASECGVGACLMHKMPNGELKPISFASRILTKAERRYATIQKEALAIFFGCKKFFEYLMGHKFTIRSDHKPLLGLFGENQGLPQMATGRVQRWALFLSNFDYKLEYVKGSNNSADGLSRLPLEGDNPIVSSEKQESGGYLNFVE